MAGLGVGIFWLHVAHHSPIISILTGVNVVRVHSEVGSLLIATVRLLIRHYTSVTCMQEYRMFAR
jgi:hypothetical protein